jgi:hypothetical protein
VWVCGCVSGYLRGGESGVAGRWETRDRRCRHPQRHKPWETLPGKQGQGPHPRPSHQGRPQRLRHHWHQHHWHRCHRQAPRPGGYWSLRCHGQSTPPRQTAPCLVPPSPRCRQGRQQGKAGRGAGAEVPPATPWRQQRGSRYCHHHHRSLQGHWSGEPLISRLHHGGGLGTAAPPAVGGAAATKS